MVSPKKYFSWLTQINRIRVLMYHKVSNHHADRLTVTTEQLMQQLMYLNTQQCTFITVRNLIDYQQQKTALPPNPVLLTFDDAYVNNLTFALPLLQQYGARATVFVPTAYVGQTNLWDTILGQGTDDIMTLEQLFFVQRQGIELALHSHTHPNCGDLSLAEMERDLTDCIQFFERHQLPFTSAFTYPYGKRPRDGAIKAAMFQLLAQKKIDCAFRVGNKVNRFSLPNPYEIQRIEIRGDESFADFKRKIIFGKLF